MTVDRRLQQTLSEVVAQRETAERLLATLQARGGDGTSGGMEERVTRLETHMEYVRRDLEDLKSGQAALVTGQAAIVTGLAELKGEVTSVKGHMAGKTTVIVVAIALFAALLAVLAFGGDRFSQGMEVRAAAEAAREPWSNDPIVTTP